MVKAERKEFLKCIDVMKKIENDEHRKDAKLTEKKTQEEY